MEQSTYDLDIDSYVNLHTRKIILGGVALVTTLIFWCAVQIILQRSKESNIYLSVDRILWTNNQKHMNNDQEKIFTFNPISQQHFQNL